MPWGITREQLIMRYCPAVADDNTNWGSEVLQDYFADAFLWLKSHLCPPFSTADVDLLNGEDTHAEMSDRLIARIAAHMIYTDLSGGDDQTEFDARQAMIDQWIEGLQNGTRTLIDSSNNPLDRESLIYHNNEDVAREATRTRYSKTTGLQMGDTGTMDLHR